MDGQIAFGQRMKAARKTAGLNQQDLADKTEIAVNSIRRYESGERKPTIDYAKKIAETLNVGVNFLSYGDVYTQAEYNVARQMSGDDTWPERLEDVEGHGDGYLRISLPGEGEEPREMGPGDITFYFNRLNAEGRAKLVDLAEILTKVPDYQKKGR